MKRLNMRRKLWPLILTLSLASNAFAQAPQRIQQGAPAQFSGWAVTEAFMQNAARTKDLAELQEQKILKLEHLRVLDLGDIEHYKMRSNQLQNQLSKEETKRSVYSFGAFMLGVIITGVAAKAAIESTR